MKKLSNYKGFDNRYNIAQAVYSTTDLNRERVIIEIATRIKHNWDKPVVIRSDRRCGKSIFAVALSKYGRGK